MIGTVEVGLIYGVMALGVFLTFRVLNLPDLTVDGSFTTGAGTAAMAILAGWNPALATLAGFGTGFLAGIVTGLLHTKGKIDGLLAGILTMIALWSVNLRIMDGANVPVGRRETAFTPLREAGLLGTWGGVAILTVAVIVSDRGVKPRMSLNMTVMQAGAIAGPLVGGALIPILGYPLLYLLDTIFLVPTLAAVVMLPALRPLSGDAPKVPGLRSVIDGLRYLGAHKILMVSFVVDLIAMTTGTVADPFAGSGSTLVAAKALGRKAIGVELEERYCEVIAKRLSQGVLDFGSAS